MIREYLNKFNKPRERKSSNFLDIPYLSQLENGKIKSPSYRVVKMLCDYYGIKTDVGDTDELTMLISTMTDLEVENLTCFAKFVLNSRKTQTT